MANQSKRLQVVFFKAGNGAEPVRDWFGELSAEDRRIIGYDIARVEFGWPVGMPV